MQIGIIIGVAIGVFLGTLFYRFLKDKKNNNQVR